MTLSCLRASAPRGAVRAGRPRPRSACWSFNAQINNDHTRKAYLNATWRLAEWYDQRPIGHLVDVQPSLIAAFIKEMQGKFSPPAVKTPPGRATHCVGPTGHRAHSQSESGPCHARPQICR